MEQEQAFSYEPVEKFFYAKKAKEDEHKIPCTVGALSVDRDGEVVLPVAFGARLDLYRKNPIVTMFHNVRTYTVGKAGNFEITEEEFTEDIEFADTEEGNKLWKLYSGGFMNMFSAGFIPLLISREPVLPGQTGPTYKEVELIETACVPVGSNRDALQRAFKDWFTSEKFFDTLDDPELDLEQKGVIPFQDLPLDTDSAWDASGAKVRLQKWASSDGTGDKDKIDFAKYRRGFCAVREGGASDNLGTYMLPIADVKNGTLTAIFRGIVAVMGVLNGARGGADISDEDRRRVYNTHVRRYYKKAGRENDLPELRSFHNLIIEMDEIRAVIRALREEVWSNEA